MDKLIVKSPDFRNVLQVMVRTAVVITLILLGFGFGSIFLSNWRMYEPLERGWQPTKQVAPAMCTSAETTI